MRVTLDQLPVKFSDEFVAALESLARYALTFDSVLDGVEEAVELVRTETKNRPLSLYSNEEACVRICEIIAAERSAADGVHIFVEAKRGEST
jgi:hypothetical protein